MKKHFLSRDLIVSVAYRMIDENGVNSFSVRQLAAELGVQVSSLYNHINNEYDLLLEVAKLTAAMYTEYIEESARGLSPEEAVYSGAEVFRGFVRDHRYLYELLLDRRWIGDPEYEKSIAHFTDPIYQYLSQFGIERQTAKDHVYVFMRVVTHGFSSLESLGIFDNLSVDAGESYHMLVTCMIDMMKQFKQKESEKLT